MSSSAAALMAVRAFRSTSLSTQTNSWAMSRSFASGSTTKKSGGAGSTGGVGLTGKNLDPPKNVYKQVDESALGPGASKQSDYKNPEYFSYHEMSFADMDLVMAKVRCPQPSNSKK